MSIKKLGTDGLEKVWEKVFSLIKVLTGDVDVSGKGTLQEQINKKADSDHSHSAATTSSNGLMSSSDKTKLNGIATGAEVNQNAFSNVVVGSTTVAADSKTDTLTLAGSNVTLTPDATNDKVTIGITKANVTSALGYTPPTTNTTYNNATTSTSGLMSVDDKKKLDGIAAGANKYTHPTNAGNKHIPSGGASSNILKWNADGTAIWGETLSTFPNNAAAHNGIFRGKDLTNVYSIDEICSRISAGTFEDLYIGDYFDITISTEYTANEKVRCVLAGFDIYMHHGASSSVMETHHAVIVPKNCFTKTHQMNTTNTIGNSENSANTSGLKAYGGSDMNQIVLKKYATAISNAIGSSHLMKKQAIFTIDVNENINGNAGAGAVGASTGYSWFESQLQLLSEIQVYGANVLSSSFYDTGNDMQQLPLFKLDQSAKVCKCGGIDSVDSTNREWYWLRNIYDKMSFCTVCCDGYPSSFWSAESYGVRPLFCIG